MPSSHGLNQFVPHLHSFQACDIIKGACKFCVNKGFVSTKALDCGKEHVISRIFLLLFDLLCCTGAGLVGALVKA